MATIHIIGAGISGLAAATRLAEAGLPVKLYEASAHAGGRCRSSRDAALGLLDHGLYLTSPADREWQRYLARIDAPALQEVSALPLPTAPLIDYLPLLGWLARPRGMAEHALAPDNQLRDGWLRPAARLLFGTLPAQLPARALRRQWRRLGWRRMRMAAGSLQEQFIQPALDYLEERGGSVYFSHALSRMERQDGRPASLIFGRKKLALGPEDIVILATPPAFTGTLLPLPELPGHSAITLHFAVEHRQPSGLHYPIDTPMDLLRFEEERIAATLRIADHAWAGDEALLAERIWQAIGQQFPALREHSLPDYAIRREKRAGHAVQELPPISHDHGALILAGDWLNPRLPASLEAAAASGHRAAALAMERLPKKPKREQAHPFRPVARPIRKKRIP